MAAALAVFALLLAAPATGRELRLEYDVVAGPGARDLAVEVGPDAPAILLFDDAMGDFAREAAARCGAGEWLPVPVAADRLDAPPCARGARRVRYRFALAEAAREHHDRRTALVQGEAILASPSTFLARPLPAAHGRFRLSVRTPPGLAFLSGLTPAGRDAYEADLEDLPEAPYSAFADARPERIRVGGGVVDLALLPGPLPVPRAAVTRWATEAARDVAGYYGRLPVPRVLVLVVPGGRRAVGHGTTMGNGGASILLSLGEAAREEDLAKDWVLTHEMVHLALPNLPPGNAWLEEGIATYVEPIARARRGRVSAAAVWADLVERTAGAVPGPGGLAGARGFRATYWGGALFCLLADLEIREKTANRRALDDALRGIQARGGSIRTRWPAEEALAAGDAAVGVDVLRPLYARMAHAASPVDLPALWARLGVSARGGEVTLDDGAPLAALRRAMTGYAPPSRPGKEDSPR